MNFKTGFIMNSYSTDKPIMLIQVRKLFIRTHSLIFVAELLT